MYWRPTSVHRDLLPKVADIIRDQASHLVTSHA
jgi:hypothetical protein